MGIDTIKLRSPNIDEGTAQFLEKQCILRQGIELSSGEVLYEITTGDLDGSWDSRVMFKVCREEWMPSPRGVPELCPCAPRIEVEASLHKFFYGQNVYGSPEDFQTRCGVFVDLLGDLLGADQDMLPSAAKWTVHRVDWAEVFRLTPAAIAEFFRGISHCKFPRRSAKSAKYGVNAVYFPGSFTTLKLYHKGPEFKEHDISRMRRALTAYTHRDGSRFRVRVSHAKHGDSFVIRPEASVWVEKKLKALIRLAMNRIRVEVEIHADKLTYDFGGRFPTVSDITDDYLKNVHDAEVYKLLKEGKSEMDTVRTHDSVKARLNNCYGKRSANALFSFWLQLAARGEEVCMTDYSQSQYYSNRRKLVDVGISWLASDIYIIPNQTALPHDFIPLRSDARLCNAPISNDSVFNHCPVDWANRRAA